MARWARGVIVVALCGSASAQPVPAPAPAPAPADQAPAPQDPYAPAPGKDPVLAEQIAEQLVGRAQELYDAKMYVDAKQLAVEALVESPKGNAAERARFLIKQINRLLGIQDEQPAPPPQPEAKPPVVDTTPIEDPTLRQPLPPVEPPAEGGTELRDAKLAAMVHGGLYGGIFGAAIGSWFDSSNAAAGAVPMGIAGGAALGLTAPMIASKLHWDEAQIRTVGAGSVWGGIFGGFFTEAVAGANTTDRVRAATVVTGAAVGSTLGLLSGAVYANQHKFTRGDVALVDTLAGVGTAGGLTLGMLMQPAQKEGYSLNAAIGAASGVIVGMIAAPQTNTTPRRMLRVAGLAAAGGAIPLSIVLASPHSEALQRTAGGLASAGLVAGAWLGFYLTRHMDEGLDVPDHKSDDAAPPSSLPPTPAPTAMTNQPAFTLPVAFGRF
ncbi:MAG: hypothetical protein ACM31C_03405 [Acidobacteriota bacterium]